MNIDRADTRSSPARNASARSSRTERLDLATEADRRRVRIELHEPEEETESASVTAITAYKRDLGLA